MKTYVITIAKHFPVDHVCKGEPTHFWEKIQAGNKIHTIRTNYDLWAKRIAEVQAGRAVLSLREWEGRPYHSKQPELMQLTAADGVGVQLAQFKMQNVFCIGGEDQDQFTVANNDGLIVYQFQSWFRKVAPFQPLAVIHFTPFRYRSVEDQLAIHSFLHVNINQHAKKTN